MKPFLLLSLLISLMPSTLWAEEVPWYQVEMVVFKNLDPFTGGSEDWQYARVPVLYPAQASTVEQFVTVPNKQFDLQGVEKLLGQNRNYQVLLHTAWIQPALSSHGALPMRIRAGVDLFDPNLTSELERQILFSDGTVPQVPAPIAELKELEGFITLMVNRYIHLEVDLVFREPVGELKNSSDPATDLATFDDPEDMVPKSGLFHYHLIHQRKMRTGEIHYFDHPKFGVILQINTAVSPNPSPQ